MKGVFPRARVSKRLLQECQRLVDDIQKGNGFADLIEMPIFWTAGFMAFTADAAGSWENEKAGWGANAKDLLMAKPWSPKMRKAMEKERISISPLEMFAAAALIETIAVSGLIKQRSRIVVCSDNESVVYVANSGRAPSKMMAMALEILNESCQRNGIEILLVHIPGESNVIADALSRGALTEAKSWSVEIFGNAKMGKIPEIAMKWEESLAIEALKSRSAPARSKSDITC